MGPIRGGGDWQRRACEILQSNLTEEFFVATPCRWGPEHPLYHDNAGGHETFSRQLPWERYYLDLAARNSPRGCVICWLPEESKTDPRKDGPYARDTYGELGEFRGRMMCDKKARFVLGAEPGFPGLDVIVRNFEGALKVGLYVSPNLEETVTRAIEVANRPIAAK